MIKSCPIRVDISPNKNKKGFFRITPHGSIDADTHDIFRQLVKPVLAQSPKGLVIDLKDVDYISSAGVGVIFAIRTLIKEKGGRLAFCNLKPQIHKLFDVMKVLPKNMIFRSLEEADAYLYAIMDAEIKKQSQK